MKKQIQALVMAILLSSFGYAQRGIVWAQDGNSYMVQEANGIIKYTLPENSKQVIFSKEKFLVPGSSSSMEIKDFQFSAHCKSLAIRNQR
jgi:hypothetical protein